MLRKSWRYGVAIAVLSAGTSWALMAAAAENLDNPTVRATQPLNGPSTITGKITPQVGFPAHIYTASKDGMVRIIIDVSNVNPKDNGGIAFRPYMRALSISNAERNGEAWSTNGYRNGATASGEIVFRVKKGEKFTIVATLGQHLESGARANANYTLTVKE
jgi:hypothetical protein